MSKHNYSQYSNTKKFTNEPNDIVELPKEIEEDIGAVIQPVVTEPKVEETPAVPEIVSKPEPEPKTVEGIVVGCTKLNVRAYPSINSDVVTVINVNDKVTIYPAASNKEWFKVLTADGDRGFCMRKFVDVKR